MNKFFWPDSAAAVSFVSVNFDAEAHDLREAAPQNLFGRYSYGRYGVRAGLDRLLGLFDVHGISATFFVAASDARRHPELVRQLVSEGHEVSARGLDLEDLTTLGDREGQVLRTSRDMLADIIGSAPKGFRAPTGTLSPFTLHHLVDLGYEYDSSFQDDDYPYRFQLHEGKSLVEIPGSFALDDAPIYSARHTHERLTRIWRDEMEAMLDAGILIPLTLHLRGDFGSTRGARIAALDTILREIKSRGQLRFMNGAELSAHAMSLGLAAEPDPYAAHEATLKSTVYRGDLAVKPL